MAGPYSEVTLVFPGRTSGWMQNCRWARCMFLSSKSCSYGTYSKIGTPGKVKGDSKHGKVFFNMKARTLNTQT